MSLKSDVVAFSSGDTAFIKEVRDLLDSKWIRIDAFKTNWGYSYEQVLEWAYITNADYYLGGDEVPVRMKSFNMSV